MRAPSFQREAALQYLTSESSLVRNVDTSPMGEASSGTNESRLARRDDHEQSQRCPWHTEQQRTKNGGNLNPLRLRSAPESLSEACNSSGRARCRSGCLYTPTSSSNSLRSWKNLHIGSRRDRIECALVLRARVQFRLAQSVSMIVATLETRSASEKHRVSSH